MYAPSRRFSRTDSSAKVPRPSGTCAIPRRATASGARGSRSPAKTSSPLRRTVPEIARSVVVFPAPFAPSTATSSPSSTSSETPWSALTGPYRASTSRSSSSGIGSLFPQARARRPELLLRDPALAEIALDPAVAPVELREHLDHPGRRSRRDSPAALALRVVGRCVEPGREHRRETLGAERVVGCDLL